MEQRIARIAVSAATFHIDRLYDYLIDGSMTDSAVPGMRVIVPFGRGNKPVEGIIMKIDTQTKHEKLKSIESVIDDGFSLSDENIKLALWMRDRFFCTVYDALRLMLPVRTDYKRLPKSKDDNIPPEAQPPEICLNAGQNSVYENILPLLKSTEPKAALLYGVTGSGKTIVYIKLIKHALQMGKTAIVLVPEIVLTPQMVTVFKSHFSNSVAVLHSGLGDGERFLQWKRIRVGEVSVVVGTRSAVFAPLENIGLIVIDEEQEHTYKSDSSPRYHARDIAKYRVTQSSGLLLLASATPSVESMYAASCGRYTLLRIDNRFNEKNLPAVLIADMRSELKSGNAGQISNVLRREIENNIEHGEQSILFINRRGANTAVVCMECGFTYKCRNCSVSMTYHISNKRLMCHYCGYKMNVSDNCPECGGILKFIGAGTQKIEQELNSIFQDIIIIRMDSDTTSRRDSHNALLKRFRETNAHILLGTQMVTKGLDFENVTLVGVLNADLSLYVSDYRANERTFSLITQVVGRSGRGEKTGRAVIQTYTPENKTILLAAKQDYDVFYSNEIELRRVLNNPPVRDLLSITVTGADEKAVIAACDMIKYRLQEYFLGNSDIRLLGPAPAPVSKVKNKFLHKLIINCTNNKEIRKVIWHVICEFMKDKKSRGLTVYADAGI